MSERCFIGVGTPQANPTVELEFRACFRGQVCMQATRLTSPEREPTKRLEQYLLQLDRALQSYDTLRLNAFAFACTGSSYLLGNETEEEITSAAQRQAGYPVITATQAIAAELKLRDVRRLAILAPYPKPLCDAAKSYWENLGFAVVRSDRIDIGADTRAIYELTETEVDSAIAGFDPGDAEILLLSGTGMPTAAALRSARFPTISSNFCLAAEALRRVGRWPADYPTDIQRLLSGP